ncbi:MAG: CotH kinase family protein [Ruminococcus sp.]|nr:CotH kinase family protein [Ruminococcus sp.]
MNNRKLLSVLAAAVLLAGCAGSDSSSGAASSPDSSETASSADSGKDASTAENSESPEQSGSADESRTSEPKPAINENASVVSFSAAGGVYPQKQSVELTSKDGGTVYYTTDGSDPRTSSTKKKYEGAVEIDKRDGDPNVASAVDTTLISGNFNEVNFAERGFVCTIKPPSDDAVDKITVLRACAEMDDGTFTKAFSNTYFIGTAEEHIQGLADSCKAMGTPLAVVSLSMDHDDLFSSDRGIYVKGDIFEKDLPVYIKNGGSYEPETARQVDANYKQKGREWERAAHAELFEISPDGTATVFSQDCGVRIQGNYSRSDLQKGLRLYAREEYGDKRFHGSIFKGLKTSSGEDIDSFKTLVLRAGGNCAFTAKFNDTYWQMVSQSLDCTTKASRPCVVYLNGEYWGLYVLEEDYSQSYFKDHFGVEKKDVVIYKGDAEKYASGYKLDEGDLPDGAKENYYFQPLMDFFKSHRSIESAEDYEEFSKLVDIESCRDYFLSEVWINNKWDWPGKNWSMWKTANTDPSNEYADGRWRFMFYDMEFGGVSGRSDSSVNTVKEDNYKPKGLLDMGTNNPCVLCFAYLMTNEGFRNDYLSRLEGMSGDIYSSDKLLAKLDELTAQYSPLFDQFFERYNGAGTAEDAVSGGYASAACIRDFIKGRERGITKIIDWVKKQF